MESPDIGSVFLLLCMHINDATGGAKIISLFMGICDHEAWSNEGIFLVELKLILLAFDLQSHVRHVMTCY